MLRTEWRFDAFANDEAKTSPKLLAFLFRVFGAVGEKKFKPPDDRQKFCAFQQRPPREARERERERRMNTGGDDDDDGKKKKNEENEEEAWGVVDESEATEEEREKRAAWTFSSGATPTRNANDNADDERDDGAFSPTFQPVPSEMNTPMNAFRQRDRRWEMEDATRETHVAVAKRVAKNGPVEELS